MAGKPKTGLDYAGWATNIFDGDTKIDRLLDAQGWIGFSVYFYLCQMAYKFDGYFYRWSYADAATTARRMGCGVKSETVKAAVGACLQIGLFDKRLFEENAILTSRGIQKRFYAAKKEKRRRTAISDYWLLEKNDESEGPGECAEFEEVCRKDGDSCSKDDDSCRKDGPERKEKESKGIEREKEDGQTGFRNRQIPPPPSFEEVKLEAEMRGIPDLAHPFYDYYSAAGWRDSEGRPVYSWRAKLVSWKVREDDRLRKQTAAQGRKRDGGHSAAAKPQSAGQKSFAELAREMEVKKNDH